MLEEKQLEQGPRVKFKMTRLGDFESVLQKESERNAVKKLCIETADALWELEQMGATPVAPDGRVGGNAAVQIDINGKFFALVSKSGKLPGRMDVEKDFCLVSTFNKSEWSAEYYSFDEDTVPTSDSPLHWFILRETAKLDWPLKPKWCLHGHAFETEEEARALDLPISTEETLFSTPEDTEALMRLFNNYSYPDNSVFVRRSHGFLALGQTSEDALIAVRELDKKSKENKKVKDQKDKSCGN